MVVRYLHTFCCYDGLDYEILLLNVDFIEGGLSAVFLNGVFWLL